MNKIPKAILDTSALISLYELDLLSYMSLLYNEVLIPDAVEKEFLENPKEQTERTDRYNYLSENLAENIVWLKRCKEYGTDIIATLDIKFQVCDYFEYTQKMMEETSTHLSEKIVKMVYDKVRNELL